MSVKHYINGKLNLIAGGSGSGNCEENTFTGTMEEVQAAIVAGEIKEDFIIFVTDDVKDKTDVLDTYEEIMNNTEEDKLPGALGVKEGFESLENSIKNVDDKIDEFQLYKVTLNDNVNAGAINIVKTNRQYIFSCSINLKPEISLTDWTEVQIGVIENWSGLLLSPLCLLTTIGYDKPSVGLRIKEDGTVFVFVQKGVGTDASNIWLYGQATVFDSIN